jgi:pimeloyl-ACP methyl ester carboxylesterase
MKAHSIVTSHDGTTIAFDRTGSGPALILVDGALCTRAFGPSGPLAEQLASQFTVYSYDRRGRGDSGDTAPYAVEREIEDLAAVIEEAGGSAHLWGISSGAVLALEAARRGLPVEKLALYEAPVIVDATRSPVPADFAAHLTELAAAERRGEAVQYFMRKAVALPAPFVALMRVMPMWSKLKKVAHTLRYDAAVVEGLQAGRALPTERWSALDVETLVIDGAKSPEWMRNGNRALADAIPGSRHRRLDGQTHMVKPKVLAPVLADFYAGAGTRTIPSTIAA